VGVGNLMDGFPRRENTDGKAPSFWGKKILVSRGWEGAVAKGMWPEDGNYGEKQKG